MQPQDSAEPVENRTLAPVYRVDDLVIDTGRVTITRTGQDLALPKLSFELLIVLEFEPAFDSLRARKDFQALLSKVRANAARELEQLRGMRADGLVPVRGSDS